MEADLSSAIAASRDSALHAGARLDALPPEFAAEVAKAPDAESARRALLKLLDQLDDRHASVQPLKPESLVLPSGTIVVDMGDERWIGFYGRSEWILDRLAPCPAPRGAGPVTVREWLRLDRVDGYAPRRFNTVVGLLEGLPGTRVEIEATTVDGARERRSLARASPETSFVMPVGALDGLADAYAKDLEFTDAVPAWFDEARSNRCARGARLGPQGRVGYLRLSSFGDSDSCKADACLAGECGPRKEIAEAIQPLLGCDTIILDLAGNSGGLCIHASEVLRWLLPRSFERVPFVHVEAGLGERLRWKAEPPERRFGGRLVVVVDASTCSAAEHVAAVLKGAPGVTLVGSPTAGAEFSVQTREYPDLGVKVSFGATPTAWDPPRQGSEGRPVQPDMLVPIDQSLLRAWGPLAAANERRIDTLAAAWRAAGLRGPEGGIWADLRSGIGLRMWWAVSALATPFVFLFGMLGVLALARTVNPAGRG